jgi:hypothetical protein
MAVLWSKSSARCLMRSRPSRILRPASTRSDIICDVVSVEHAAGLMTRDDHGNLLRNAVADHISDPTSYSFSLPHDWHFAPVTFWRHPLHKKTPTSAETHADHQASLKSLIGSPSSLVNALVSKQHYLLGASAILFSFVLPLLVQYLRLKRALIRQRKPSNPGSVGTAG